MADPDLLDVIAHRLLDAFDTRTMLEPMSVSSRDFSGNGGYDVLRRVDAVRRARGWRTVGRKIGFTNSTLWERYGVVGPMWAHVWDRTRHLAPDGLASIDISHFVQPRIEPEIVFSMASTPPVTEDPEEMLAHVEWMAAGFEIVQCLFPGWKFAAADSVAAFGLHGALVVGPPVAVLNENRGGLVGALVKFDATLSRDGSVVATGSGANVLGSPVRALINFVRLLAEQGSEPLLAGEVVTTGTLTDAQPVVAGERWTSSYGSLGIEGLDVVFS